MTRNQEVSGVKARQGQEVVVPRIGAAPGRGFHVRAECGKALQEGDVSLRLPFGEVAPELVSGEDSEQLGPKLGRDQQFKGSVHPGLQERPRSTLGRDQGGNEDAGVDDHAEHLGPSTPVQFAVSQSQGFLFAQRRPGPHVV